MNSQKPFNTDWQDIRNRLGGAIFQYQNVYRDKQKRAELVEETSAYLNQLGRYIQELQSKVNEYEKSI